VNRIDLVVDGGPVVAGAGTSPGNVAYVSVKVCAPGRASQCVVVDHVQVDTGSAGLRLNGAAVTVSFVVDNLDRVIERGVDVNAYDAAGGEDATTFGTHVFDWGLPFFMGRPVFTAIGTSRAAGIAGPWVAY